MRTGSLRGAPLAGLVSAYHAVHAGPCGVICVASARRKKLPTRKCGSAYRSSATCSPECCGADGTPLNTCCIGPGGEDNINSGPCAATIESADQPCLHSIYNCSTKPAYVESDRFGLVGVSGLHKVNKGLFKFFQGSCGLLICN